MPNWALVCIFCQILLPPYVELPPLTTPRLIHVAAEELCSFPSLNQNFSSLPLHRWAHKGPIWIQWKLDSHPPHHENRKKSHLLMLMILFTVQDLLTTRMNAEESNFLYWLHYYTTRSHNMYQTRSNCTRAKPTWPPKRLDFLVWDTYIMDNAIPFVVLRECYFVTITNGFCGHLYLATGHPKDVKSSHREIIVLSG